MKRRKFQAAHRQPKAKRRRDSMSAILERIRTRRESIRLPADWPGTLKLLREDRRR